MASATVATSGATSGAFAYVMLSSTVTLAAGGTYYLVSTELNGGDQWYDNNTSVGLSTDASSANSVFFNAGTYTVPGGTAGKSYVPVDLIYSLTPDRVVSPIVAPSRAAQRSASW